METPIQSCSKTRGLPGLPPLPGHVEEPSDLYKVHYYIIGFSLSVIIIHIEKCIKYKEMNHKSVQLINSSFLIAALISACITVI